MIGCCLCLTYCHHNYKSVYDGNDGRPNENYYIVVKYFDEQNLVMKQGQPPPLICLECWGHIIEFHNFRESVLLAQSNFTRKAHIPKLQKKYHIQQTQNLIVLSHEKPLPKRGQKEGSTDIVLYDIYVMDEKATVPQSEGELEEIGPSEEVSDVYNQIIGEGVAGKETTLKQVRQTQKSDTNAPVQCASVSVSQPQKMYTNEFVGQLQKKETQQLFARMRKMYTKETKSQHKKTDTKESCSQFDQLRKNDINVGQFQKKHANKSISQKDTNEIAGEASEEDILIAVEVMEKDKQEKEKFIAADMGTNTDGYFIERDIKEEDEKEREEVISADMDTNAEGYFSVRDIKEDGEKGREEVVAADMETNTDGYFNDEQEDFELSSLSELESIDGKFSSDEDGTPLLAFAVESNDTQTLHTDNNSIQTHNPNVPRKSQNRDIRRRRSCPNVSRKNQNRDIKRRRSGPDLEKAIAEWKPNLPCNHCDESRNSFMLLKRHYNEKHSNEIFYVECCSTKFRRRSGLAEHLRYHKNPSPITCEICDRRLCSVRALQHHYRQKHTNSPRKQDKLKVDNLLHLLEKHFECGLCNRPYSTYKQLRAHFRCKHDSQKCFIICCGQKLHLPNLIEEHMLMHNDSSGDFACKLCPQTSFTEKKSLEEHMLSHHNISVNKMLQDPSSIEDNVNACPYKKRRKTANILNASIAEWRPTLECEICHEVCLDFSFLKDHFSWKHPGDKCYVPCCGIKFTRRSVLEQHARFHLDYNAFKCKICGRVLRRKICLQKHMELMHAGE